MQNKRVLVMGVFDLFHVGHLRYLQYASKQGDFLTVGVLPDQSCYEIKNKKPIIFEQQRMEIILGLKCVDDVVLLPSNDTLKDEIKFSKWVCSLNIDIIVVGNEWKQSLKWSKRKPLLEKEGIGIVFAPHTNEISSSKIIKSVLKLYKRNNNG